MTFSMNCGRMMTVMVVLCHSIWHIHMRMRQHIFMYINCASLTSHMQLKQLVHRNATRCIIVWVKQIMETFSAHSMWNSVEELKVEKTADYELFVKFTYHFQNGFNWKFAWPDNDTWSDCRNRHSAIIIYAHSLIHKILFLNLTSMEWRGVRPTHIHSVQLTTAETIRVCSVIVLSVVIEEQYNEGAPVRDWPK